MSEPIARLVYAYGMPEEREYDLRSPTVTIGRESINEVVFDDAEVSRRHVRITQLAGRFIIEDLGSTNGTFLNGRRIEAPAPLANGDVIDLGGSVRLTYLGPPGAAEATVVEPTADQLGAPSTVVRATPAGEISPAGEMPLEEVPPLPYSAPLTPPPVAPAWESPAPRTSPLEPPPYSPPQAEEREWSRYFIGCGCLIILAVIACAVTLVLLDALAPNTLYCGPLQTIFESLGFNLACA